MMIEQNKHKILMLIAHAYLAQQQHRNVSLTLTYRYNIVSSAIKCKFKTDLKPDDILYCPNGLTDDNLILP